jgi:hypothetical protein
VDSKLSKLPADIQAEVKKEIDKSAKPKSESKAAEDDGAFWRSEQTRMTQTASPLRNG